MIRIRVFSGLVLAVACMIVIFNLEAYYNPPPSLTRSLLLPFIRVVAVGVLIALYLAVCKMRWRPIAAFAAGIVCIGAGIIYFINLFDIVVAIDSTPDEVFPFDLSPLTLVMIVTLTGVMIVVLGVGLIVTAFWLHYVANHQTEQKGSAV